MLKPCVEEKKDERKPQKNTCTMYTVPAQANRIVERGLLILQVLRQIQQRKIEHTDLQLKFHSQHLWTANPWTRPATN